MLFLAVGCGAPGEPTPPTPPVPAPVSDLAAHQAGDGAQLVFTLPSISVTGDKLAAPPAVEILRGNLKTGGSPDTKSFRVVYTIPGVLVDNYRFGSHIVFTDPIAPAETKAHPGASVTYLIRTRASRKRASADSNVVSVRVFPVPEPISSLEARVTESAIELNWPAPTHTSSGDPLSSVGGYHIYRNEINAAAASSSPGVNLAGEAETNPVPLGSSQTNSYSDTSFLFDHAYIYVVRSVIQADGTLLESSDSQPLRVAPRDTFPPAAPQNLVAVSPHCVADAAKLYVELSWSMNLETDLAAYRVYRNDEEGKQGQLLQSFWIGPSYRDNAVASEHRYWYTVTALDRAGNESSASAPVLVFVQAEQCQQ
ncbi:MAG TPA: hypothetical protein VFN26_06820 [Candidatus Acidoferrum sp.]|nr:hypothetical protein [Candidatus Acidoferrum sp.]